jgi:hypothetical protein
MDVMPACDEHQEETRGLKACERSGQQSDRLWMVCDGFKARPVRPETLPKAST